ncbi:MAG TPA: host attachment protein [Steroidobacteraceae bacterium]|jgi:protein required for attachment to host cells|nr:host attachment protein [Steroidobacteraceae bacterium]
MRIRVAVADRAQVLFYDAERPESKLRLAGQMTDPEARLRDRDYKSDRPGRVFDHAPGGKRRGAVAHHSTGGERTPSKHEAGVFARRIVDELERAQRQNHFDRLVLMAAPEFLGDLREVMPKSLRQAIALEIDKNLVHEDELAIREHLPADVFVQRL